MLPSGLAPAVRGCLEGFACCSCVAKTLLKRCRQCRADAWGVDPSVGKKQAKKNQGRRHGYRDAKGGPRWSWPRDVEFKNTGVDAGL